LEGDSATVSLKKQLGTSVGREDMFQCRTLERHWPSPVAL